MKWKEDLRKFEKDNYSGSAELLEQYIDLILYWLEKGDIQTQKDHSYLIGLVRKLSDTHKTLFVLMHFYNQVSRIMNQEKDEWVQVLSEFLREYKIVWSDVSTKLASQAVSIIDMNQRVILTHSQSSAVKEVFNRFPGSRKKVKVYQTESRPVYEGRIQASHLQKLGYDVSLVTDTGYSRHLDKITMILLGADAVYRNYFVNKAGTYNICLAGKNAGIPIYVMADSRKFWSSLPPDRQELGYIEEQKPVDEIWPNPPTGIDIENYYFEKTPLAWIDGFITENEILKASRVENLKPVL